MFCASRRKRKENQDGKDDDSNFSGIGFRMHCELKIPVLTPSVHNALFAEEAVTEGWPDMVMLARPLLADPEVPNEVKRNRIDDINRCKKDSCCWVTELPRLPHRCSVNPEFGREKYNPKYQIREGFKGEANLHHYNRSYTQVFSTCTKAVLLGKASPGETASLVNTFAHPPLSTPFSSGLYQAP